VSQQHNNNDAVLDRQISEQDARIRSNPRDAVAYRERGFFYARKHELDQALKDLNQAVVLNPLDSRAFSLRGLRAVENQDSTRSLFVIQATDGTIRFN
jgi:regulator of sirC expression with transglutaminase-like and TPR domain